MIESETLKEALEKNIKNFEGTSVVVLITDLENNVIFISDAAQILFDINQDNEALTIDAIFSELKKHITENDFDSTEIKEFSYLDKTGKKRWFKMDKSPFISSSNQTIGSIMYLTDITSKTLLQIETEQLNQILNAHLKVEEVLKNNTDSEKFADELSKEMVEKKIFSALMIEYFHDYSKQDVSQFAYWIEQNGQLGQAFERQIGFTKCLNEYIENDKQPFHIHNTHSNCPWNHIYKRTNAYNSTIVYGSKIYGSVCIRLNDGWQFSEKTKNLMNQLVDKIAFGFYSLETQIQINAIQEEMEEQLRLYKRALDATNDGIWDWDIHSNEVFYSDRYFTMLGFEPNQFPNTIDTWKSLIHKDDYELAFKIIQMEIENKSEGFEVEFRMKTKKGKYIWILGRGKVYKRDTNGNPLKIIGTHVDITDLKEQEKELEQKNDQLENINEELIANNEEIREMNKELEKLYKEQEDLSNQTALMLRLMGQISLLGTDEKTFLDECLDLVFNMIPATTSGKIIMLDGEKYTVLTAHGSTQKDLIGLSLRRNNLQIPEKVKLLSKDEIYNLYSVNAFTEERVENSLAEVKEGILTPIIWNGNIWGCIQIYNENDSDIFFAFSDLKKMTSFSNLLSIFYRLRKYMKEEGKFQTDLILTLVKALEYYDAYTRGHSERVAIWSAELAKVVGVDEEGQRQIYFASLMHDIGKIFVPQNVLNKVTRLTEDEYLLIQSHSTKSAELINKVEGMENFSNIVLHHHEKYDGSGYPEGLKGKAIPYFSRIIAIADSYDAMTSNRPYRKPFDKTRAINEIMRCKGTQFDPSLVEPFIEKVLKNKNISIPVE